MNQAAGADEAPQDDPPSSVYARPNAQTRPSSHPNTGQWSLYENRRGLASSLDRMVQHICGGENAAGMTFGVFGPWGTGKSTALNYLHHRIQQSAIGADVTFSYFDAARWQHHPNVRDGLTYEIIQGFMGENWHDFANELFDPEPPARGKDPVHSEQGIYSASMLFGKLRRGYDSLPLPEDQIVDRMIADRKTAGPMFTHVVFVDDVDRCSEKFTAEMLAAINNWTANPRVRLFFVVAADRRHLLRALEEHLPRGSGSPSVALEKYIHVTLDMPILLRDRTEVSGFIADAWWRLKITSDDRLQPVKDLLRASERSFPDSVLAPLLQVDPHITPRDVITRINRFSTEFRPAQSELSESIVKGWVIKAFWPNFWWETIEKLDLFDRNVDDRGDFAAERNRLEHIVRYGQALRPLYDLALPELTQALHFLAQREGVDVSDIDPRLAIYLASDPPYRLPFEATPGPGGPQDPFQIRLDTGRDLGNEIFDIYVKSESALAQGRTEECLDYVRQIAELAREDGVPSTSSDYVGNTAVTATMIDQMGLALDLYRSSTWRSRHPTTSPR